MRSEQKTVCSRVYVCVVDLWVSEAGRVRVEVELDPIDGSGQRESTYEQHQQHQIWKCGSKVNDLQQNDEVHQKQTVNMCICTKNSRK